MFTFTGFYIKIKNEYHLQGDINMADFNGGWIEFYSEFADVLLKYRHDRNELIRIIKKVFESIDMKLPKLEKDNLVVDIDPFTAFGLFNKGITDLNRKKIIKIISVN